jgi:phospholipase C
VKNKFGIAFYLFIVTALLAACAENATPIATASPQRAAARIKIKHIVIIMQENPFL